MQERGARQLRKGRFSETNRIYHISTVTRDRHPVFVDLDCARILIQSLKREHAAESVRSLCFVVMPDHLHWMFVLGPAATLPSVVRRVKTRSTRLINRHRGRNGSIWAPNFYDRAIRYDEDVVSLARYIVANPIRAGLVDSVGNYPHWDAVWLDADAQMLF